MAINDLNTHLKDESFKLDDKEAEPLVKALLLVAETDTNADVRSLAVRWYAFYFTFNMLIFAACLSC